MGKRVPKATHQPFESDTMRGPFAKITLDMMASPAWRKLNLRQQGLYLHLKAKYLQKVIDGVLASSNKDNISIPTSEARQLFGDQRTFRADIDKLIEHGFIRMVQRGWNTREVNIYGFSERWKDYGKPDYQIPYSELRQPPKAAVKKDE